MVFQLLRLLGKQFPFWFRGLPVVKTLGKHFPLWYCGTFQCVSSLWMTHFSYLWTTQISSVFFPHTVLRDPFIRWKVFANPWSCPHRRGRKLLLQQKSRMPLAGLVYFHLLLYHFSVCFNVYFIFRYFYVLYVLYVQSHTGGRWSVLGFSMP